MDRLLERVRRDRLRLHHGLHHGVLPGDRRLDAGRRPAPRRPRARDGRQRRAAGRVLGPPRAEGPPAGRQRHPAALDPGVRLHDGRAVAGPLRRRNGCRGRRLPVVVERDYRRSDDDGAARRRVRPLVRPEQRLLRDRVRAAPVVPVHPGADRDRQPYDPRGRARHHGRPRLRHADRVVRPSPERSRDDPHARGAAEGDGLETAPQVLRHQRPHRPRRRILHPPRPDVPFLKFGVADTWSGPLLALANVTIGLAATVSASLARRYGPVRAIVMAQGASTVFMFSLAFVTNAFAAGGLYLVRAALMNMSAPIGDSFLMGIIAPEQRGLASAVNSIIWRLPNSVTTVLGGILMAGGYLDIPIFLATAFYLASIASFYAVFRNIRASG